jgi:hypothetical protein
VLRIQAGLDKKGGGFFALVVGEIEAALPGDLARECLDIIEPGAEERHGSS